MISASAPTIASAKTYFALNKQPAHTPSQIACFLVGLVTVLSVWRNSPRKQVSCMISEDGMRG